MLSPQRQPTKQQRVSNAHLAQAQRLMAGGALLDAEKYFHRAVDADKTSAQALTQMGNFYFKQHKPQQALPYFVRMTQLTPANAVTWRNLGVAAAAAGEHTQALHAFEQAVALKPDYAVAHHGHALALASQRRHVEAIPVFQTLIALTPKDHEAFYNFANSLVAVGELDAAEAAFQVSLSLQQDFLNAHCNLGKLYFDRNQCDLALLHLRRAVSLAGDQPIPHKNLGAVLQHLGQLSEALACYETARRLDPDSVEVIGNIGSVRLSMGDVAGASVAYSQALAPSPEAGKIFSDYLFCLQNDHTISNETLFAEHQQFAARFEAPLRPLWPQHTNTREPNRRLRIGYVSGDLRNHAVTFFLEPLLRHRNRADFCLFAYSNHAQVDEVTQRLRPMFDHWLQCAHFSHTALAEQIRFDQIDILVDLSGHTAHNRLLTFARKPAPIQVTYLGYGGTTGLTAMDYRITDPWLDPVGVTDDQHSEALVRLPSGAAGFQWVENAPSVNTLPALRGEGVTLACLNNPRKIRPPVVKLWARILAARPETTLMLGNAADPAIQQSLLAQFAENGIAAARVSFQPWMTLGEYLAAHNQIDLALDPFPYNGGTTSFHSLWMGVPFVTLAGNRTMSRVGACILGGIGLNEWVAESEDDYVACVHRALDDLPALNELRLSLRDRLNPAGAPRALAVTQSLEAAYRQMWQRWCETADH
jgi:protein O-GlcNAc transferase